MDGAAILGDAAGDNIGSAQIDSNDVAHALTRNGGRATEKKE
jgi:hypothetical protein